MTNATVYGWCRSWQCVADWTWGQNANNLATLLGAIATFAAAWLALHLSQKETRRLRDERQVQARLIAIATEPLVRRVIERLKAARSALDFDDEARAKFDSYNQSLNHGIACTRAEREKVEHDSLIGFSRIGSPVAIHLAAANSILERARDAAEFGLPAELDPMHPPISVSDLRSLLDQAIRQFELALAGMQSQSLIS